MQTQVSTVILIYIHKKIYSPKIFFEFCQGYDGIILNDNIPYFNDADLDKPIFQQYSDLDKLNRAGMAFAKLGTEFLPTKKRGSIHHLIPAGWHNVQYDFLKGKYLYNKSHLIGYQLTGYNNIKNLFTGSRYININMLHFENFIASYIKKTKNHVLYRVTPIFQNNNLLPHGVLLEAKSVEDNGKGISFNTYLYNIQPNISINYCTGDSKKI